jgi:hypothetical protein
MDVESIPENFYIDIAVGVLPFADVCALHKLDPAEVEQLEGDPTFKQRMGIAQQSVDDDGRAFRARCRSIVNRSIARMESLMGDPSTPASTRLDAFKTLARFGELEPEKKEVAEGSKGPQLVFNIYGPDGQPLIEQPVQGRVVSDQDTEDANPVLTLPPAPLAAVSGFF